MKNPIKILVCDDDQAVRSSLKFLFTKGGYKVNCAASPGEILSLVREREFNLVLLDMNYSSTITGEEGLELIQQIKVLRPSMPVVLFTAWGSVELAVRGMKLGASNFITKPWNNQELLKTVETSISLAQSQSKTNITSSKDSLSEDFPGIIGRDPKLQEILNLVIRVAPTQAPILISGESGTGKELIAEAIHHHSSRKDKPFVKVNLGGLASSVFESEMFGHVKGAFTDAYHDRAGRFEIADKGTIFLDEIGELDLNSQVKLLRVLQDQTFERLGDSRSISVDVRFISATNRKLTEEVINKTFREDLLYRINLIQIDIPPLRKRRNDIPLLVNWLLKSAFENYQLPTRILSPDAMEWLCEQNWPGNIRELKNIVERTVLYGTSEQIKADDIIKASHSGLASTDQTIHTISSSKTLTEVEREMIRNTIGEYGPNMSRIAKKLGISRATLYRKMNKYGLKDESKG